MESMQRMERLPLHIVRRALSRYQVIVVVPNTSLEPAVVWPLSSEQAGVSGTKRAGAPASGIESR